MKLEIRRKAQNPFFIALLLLQVSICSSAAYLAIKTNLPKANIIDSPQRSTRNYKEAFGYSPGRLTNPLVITDVISNDDCFVSGPVYTVQIKFQYVVEKAWEIKLNETLIENLDDILLTDELSATVRISSDYYSGRSGFGDTRLSIKISSDGDIKYVDKVICSRLLTTKVSVSTVKAAIQRQWVTFHIDSSAIQGKKHLYINFGQPAHASLKLRSNIMQIYTRYYYHNVYTYHWKFVSDVFIEESSGEIHIMDPVLDAWVYYFRKYTEKIWPDNSVFFYVDQHCGYTAPTMASYKLHFGDGDVTPWTPAPIFYCSRRGNLQWHTYKKPGCYDVHFELRNLLGQCELFQRVVILQTINSLTVIAQSTATAAPVLQEQDGTKLYYVQDANPFNVTAVTTGGGCRNFEFRILDPYWQARTYEWNNVIIDHLVNKIGSYDVEVRVSNQMNSMTERIKVIVAKSVSGLLLLANSIGKEGNVTLYLLAREPGYPTTFQWKFGDGTTLTEKTPTFAAAVDLPNIGTVSGADDINLNIYSGILKKYQYKSNGLYNVETTASDWFRKLTVKRSIFISNSTCLRPTVNILVQKGAKRLIFSIGETFTILTDVDIECDDSNQAVFEWKLFTSSKEDFINQKPSESDKSVSFPFDVVTNQREITIQKRSLSPGMYIVRLKVLMQNLGFSDADEEYLEIIEEPLHVKIEGGAQRLLPWEKEIILNGSSSYDPNVINGTVGSLVFKWYCKVKPGTLYFRIGKGGCFGYGDNLVEHLTAIWKIPPKEFIRNAVYIISLVVESRSTTYRRSFFEQAVEIRSKTGMKTATRCIANCKDKLDPQMRLSLTGSCADCGKHVTYKWTLLTRDSIEVPLRWMLDTRTPQNSVSFVLLPSILSRSMQYFARFSASTPTGETGYTDYGFSLSITPHGGFCTSTPNTGEAVKTNYYISCYGWKGESSTLHYSVSLVSATAEVGTLKDESESSVLSYGPIPYVTTTLPEGAKEKNYTQQLEVRIIDSYGASVAVNLTVQVLPYTARKDANSSIAEKPTNETVEDELGAYVYGKNSTLSILVGSGDFQALGRFTSAFGKTLDSAKNESTTTYIPENVKAERKLKREKMRESLVDSLTEVKVTTLDNLALISSALKGVSEAEDELNEESQDKMLRFYDTASIFMEESYFKWTDRDPKAIQDAVGNFLEGVGNMMGSAVLSRSNKTSEESEYLNFAKESLRILESSSSLLFQSMVANEIARRVTGKSVTVEVKRSEESQLDSILMETIGGGRVRSPSKPTLANDTDMGLIDLKMITLQRNPYTWDKSNIGKILSPITTSIQYLSDGKELPVKNLSLGDEVVYEVPTPGTPLVKNSIAFTSDELINIDIELPAKGLSLMMKPQCFGSPCRINIQFGEIQSPGYHSESFEIEDSYMNINETQFKLFSNVDGVGVNLKITKTRRSSVNESQAINGPNGNGTTIFDLEFFSTGCFHWKKEEEIWSSDGCRISNESSVSRTICLCNHLTWFGAGIAVKPNAIDVKKEIIKIKELTDYPALLATVCIIFGLYLIAMIWARHNDKQDILKTNLMIVDNCCQTHEYRYDVTIYTGSRPGSGTTSSVCIILGGSLGESDPHCLSNRPEVLFKRGSVDTFLVTSALDLGNIACIRLWHDNTGNSPNWFVSRVIVTDILKNRQTTFVCHTWLGIGIDDGNIDKTFIAASEEELKDFETIFLATTSRGFSDDHLWFSIVMRPPRSTFTRCQRVTCCLCTLLCTMLANAMFYETTYVAGKQIRIGSFQFSWRQIAIGVQSALIVVPINLLIVTMFRKAGPSFKSLLNAKQQDIAAHSFKSSTDDVQNTAGVDIEKYNDNSAFEGDPKQEKKVDLEETFVDIEKREPNKITVKDSSSYPFALDMENSFYMKSSVEDLKARDSPTLYLVQSLNPGENFHDIPTKPLHQILPQYCQRQLVSTSLQEKCTPYNEIKNVLRAENRNPIQIPNAQDPSIKSTVECATRKERWNVTRTVMAASLIPVPKFRKYETNSSFSVLRRNSNRKEEETKKLETILTPVQDVDHSYEHREVAKSNVDLVELENVVLNVERKRSSSEHKSLMKDAVAIFKRQNIEYIPGTKVELTRNTDALAQAHSSKSISRDDRSKNGDTMVYWPHWCQYFAWFICIITTITAGFFTLLYGLSFGKVVQEEWLVSFFTSIFQDVFISQPIKVVFIGCIFAFILRKLSVDEKLPEVEMAKNENWIKSNLPVQDKKATGSKVMIPLTQSYVQKVHHNRLKEIRMTNLSVEIVVYFFYIFLALLIAYGHRSPNAYIMGANINNMMVKNKFDKITSVREFWKWIDSSFLPSMYSEVWYNGDSVEQKGFVADYVTLLIGSPMIRQIRVVPEKCNAYERLGLGNKTCGGVYSYSIQDSIHYEPGWITVSESAQYGTERAEQFQENPWKYHSNLDTKSHSFMSGLHTYPGGGYIRSLGTTLQEANSSLSYLKRHLWIDSFTRSVFLEFTVYNNNDNFYCIATLVLECTADGGAVPFSRIVSTRLDRYNSEFSFFLAVCEISFLLLSFYYMWLELKKFRKKGFYYFRETSSLVELFIFSITWATFGLLLVRLGIVNWTKSELKNNPGGFTSFQYAASSDLAYGYAMAAVVVLAFLKILKILRFNKNMLLLMKTLQYAGKDLRYYMIFFGVAFMGYVCWANLTFGRSLSRYATFLRSFMSVLNLMLGSSQYLEFESANRVIAPCFFGLFVVSMNMILVNLFLTIVIDAFTVVREEMSQLPNKYDILDFLYARFITFCPCLLKSRLKQDFSDVEVEEYYNSRLKKRKGEFWNDDIEFGLLAIAKGIDIIDSRLAELLLWEYEEIEELARLALYKRCKRQDGYCNDIVIKNAEFEDNTAGNIQSERN